MQSSPAGIRTDTLSALLLAALPAFPASPAVPADPDALACALAQQYFVHPAFGLLPDMAAGLSGEADRPLADPGPQVPVPPDLADLHSPRRAERAWAHLLDAVREPVRSTAMAGGVQVIQVLGTVVLLRWPDGQLQTFIWCFGASGDAHLEHVSEEQVVLQGMPWRMLWLQNLQAGFSLELIHSFWTQGITLAPERAQAYSRWLFAAFGRALKQHADLRLMRRRIAAALGLDPEAMAIAARLYGSTARIHANTCLVANYNLVLRRRDEFQSLQREAPQALALYAVCCEQADFAAQGQPTERLKQYLQRHKIPPSAWRRVLSCGQRLFLPTLDYYRRMDAPTWLDHLRVVTWLDDPSLPQPQQLPQRWLLDVIFLLHGNPQQRRLSYCHVLYPRIALWTHLLRLWAGQPQPASAQMADLVAVANWIADAKLVDLNREQRALGWRYLVKRAKAWHGRKRRLAAVQRLPALALHAALQRGEWSLNLLSDSFELWQEGAQMGHCLGKDLAAELGPNLIYASVLEQGRRIATAEFRWNGQRWVLAQARGRFNQNLPQQVIDHITAFAPLMVARQDCEASLQTG